MRELEGRGIHSYMEIKCYALVGFPEFFWAYNSTVASSSAAAFTELAHLTTAPLFLINVASSTHRHSEQGCPPGLVLPQMRHGAIVVIRGGRN
jgi:hypothetical protein